MKRDMKLFVESPWYGVQELTEEPGVHGPNIECWDGKTIHYLVTETLRPLTREAAAMLGVRWGDKVWDENRKRAWENEPLAPFLPLPYIR